MTTLDRKLISSWEALREVVVSYRRANQAIALTNGCYDLLHVGHIRSLQGARAQADLLLVAINSDLSVRRYKGPGHPAVPESERAEILAALQCVDHVYVFGEPTVDRLLELIKPDAYCKGPEYDMTNLPERELVKRLGLRFVNVGDPKDHSSTELAARIVNRHQGGSMS